MLYFLWESNYVSINLNPCKSVRHRERQRKILKRKRLRSRFRIKLIICWTNTDQQKELSSRLGLGEGNKEVLDLYNYMTFEFM